MIRLYAAAGTSAPILVLGHGAGAGHDHPWMIRVANGLAARGIDVATFNFPYKDAGRSLPDRGPVLEQAFQAAWLEAAAAARGPMFAGGKSMGGRIASQAAALGSLAPAPAGLVFFGYPLHPPGKPHQRRDSHLPDISSPLLFLSGTRDPFASPDELQALAAGLARATVHLVEGGDHSLAASKKQSPEGSSIDRAMDVAAKWMLGIKN